MKHSTIPRILVLILVIVLVVIYVILACTPVRAAECRLEGKPLPTPWEPDETDIAYISRTIWGEVRGCCKEEQIAQGWNVLCRVSDPRFPNTIREVVTAKNQFYGYSPNNPAEPFWDMAREILIQWHNGEWGIPPTMCWCSGDGKHQTFRDSYIVTQETQFWPER